MIPGNNLRDNMFMHPVYGPAFLELEKENERLRAALQQISALRGEAVFATSHRMCDMADAALHPNKPSTQFSAANALQSSQQAIGGALQVKGAGDKSGGKLPEDPQ